MMKQQHVLFSIVSDNMIMCKLGGTTKEAIIFYSKAYKYLRMGSCGGYEENDEMSWHASLSQSHKENGPLKYYITFPSLS
jgi:hypothetical protein